MTRVTVSFEVEADDPEHSTGLTADRYDEIADAVLELGGENLDFLVAREATDG